MSTGTPHLLALIKGSMPLAILRYSLASGISPDFFASSAACLNIFCRSNNIASCLSCRVAKAVFLGGTCGDTLGTGPLAGGRRAGFSGVITTDPEDTTVSSD